MLPGAVCREKHNWAEVGSTWRKRHTEARGRKGPAPNQARPRSPKTIEGTWIAAVIVSRWASLLNSAARKDGIQSNLQIFTSWFQSNPLTFLDATDVKRLKIILFYREYFASSGRLWFISLGEALYKFAIFQLQLQVEEISWRNWCLKCGLYWFVYFLGCVVQNRVPYGWFDSDSTDDLIQTLYRWFD